MTVSSSLTASDHRIIWKEPWWRWLSPNLKYCPKSYLEWLREITKTLTIFMLILITFKTIINNKGYTTSIYGIQSLQNEYKEYEVKVFWNVTLCTWMPACEISLRLHIPGGPSNVSYMYDFNCNIWWGYCRIAMSSMYTPVRGMTTLLLDSPK